MHIKEFGSMKPSKVVFQSAWRQLEGRPKPEQRDPGVSKTVKPFKVQCIYWQHMHSIKYRYLIAILTVSIFWKLIISHQEKWLFLKLLYNKCVILKALSSREWFHFVSRSQLASMYKQPQRARRAFVQNECSSRSVSVNHCSIGFLQTIQWASK